MKKTITKAVLNMAEREIKFQAGEVPVMKCVCMH